MGNKIFTKTIETQKFIDESYEKFEENTEFI